MKFKEGDRIIVINCPRNSKELGLIGTVTYFYDRIRESGTIWVLLDGKEHPFTFCEESIRHLTPLDELL